MLIKSRKWTLYIVYKWNERKYYIFKLNLSKLNGLFKYTQKSKITQAVIASPVRNSWFLYSAKENGKAEMPIRMEG